MTVNLECKKICVYGQPHMYVHEHTDIHRVISS